MQPILKRKAAVVITAVAIGALSLLFSSNMVNLGKLVYVRHSVSSIDLGMNESDVRDSLAHIHFTTLLENNSAISCRLRLIKAKKKYSISGEQYTWIAEFDSDRKLIRFVEKEASWSQTQ